jgi:hypothetical protein
MIEARYLRYLYHIRLITGGLRRLRSTRGYQWSFEYLSITRFRFPRFSSALGNEYTFVAKIWHRRMSESIFLPDMSSTFSASILWWYFWPTGVSELRIYVHPISGKQGALVLWCLPLSIWVQVLLNVALNWLKSRRSVQRNRGKSDWLISSNTSHVKQQFRGHQLRLNRVADYCEPLFGWDMGVIQYLTQYEA